ncbi:MAG: LamG-like jellyroll fold domain-containing protein [Planctomycetota bacterium]
MTSAPPPRGSRFVSIAVLLTAVLCQPSLSAQVRRAVLDTTRDHERIAAFVGTERFSVQPLSLPHGMPERFSVEVGLGGGLWTLELGRHSVRSGTARLRVYQADGALVDAPLPPVSTYRGIPAGLPGATVLASLGRHGLSARVQFGDSLVFTILPLAEILNDRSGPEHVLFRGELPSPELGTGCALAESQDRSIATPPGAPAAPATAPLVEAIPEPAPWLKLCQIAFDGDYEFYLNQGGTVAAAVAKIDANMNLVDFFYARDVLITYEITQYIIRTAPFYFPTSGGSLLGLFQAEWNNNHGDVIRDITHLMTGKPGWLIEYGGLAYVGVVCNVGLSYGWSMDNAGIVGHEIGHNWNAGHCHDLTPCNNMCGICFYVAPITKDIIMSFRASRTCLDDAPPYATPVPPYAHPDSITLSKVDYTELLNGVEIDVLANDHDANRDRIVIHSFDTVTQNGATVSLTSGPMGGRQRLVYTPPPNPVLGEDHFVYQTEAGPGGLATGNVTVRLYPDGMTGYWKLDDGAGNVATNSIDPSGNATLSGSAAWTSGLYGGSLLFGGSGDSADIPPLYLNTNRLTLSSWIYTYLDQFPYAGLIFARGGSTLAGLHLGDHQDLRYTWNGDPATSGWSSGLIIPKQRWVFVSLVVEPEQATLYLYDGTLHSATNAVTHHAEAFDTVTYLGQDPSSTNRSFAGHMDDVRIFRYAMSSDEVSQLARLGGAAYAPNPADGATAVNTSSGLSWTAGHHADSHDVYLGTDFSAVKAANVWSPEYRGNQSATTFPLSALESGTPYLWRIDERAGAEVVPGDVWKFTPVVMQHYALNELSGSTAFDSSNDDDGTYVNAPILGQPGATPSLGTSVFFNGLNARVDIPPLNINSNTVTITAWVKISGTARDYAGIVFSRDGNSACGLQMGVNEELRYTWNGDPATTAWNSGLVLTSDVWAFCALVVEPHQATLYRVVSGVVTSATHHLAHSAEEFDGVTWIAQSGSSNASLRAHIDDVRIYNCSLTSLQIASLYANSL